MRDIGNPAERGRYSGFDRDPWMQTVIIVIHLMVVLAMTGVVLLQRSEGGGLGMGNTGGFLTSRGSANVLTRTTATLAAVFFATSLLLSILAGWDRKPHSILQGTNPATQPAGPVGAPQPLAPGGRGVLDTLRQQGQPSGGQPGQPAAPPAPAAPAGPQVPQSK
jgi:preprotein translocase subunit SecG